MRLSAKLVSCVDLGRAAPGRAAPGRAALGRAAPRRRLARLCLALSAAAAGIHTAVAGPLDARASSCSINSGGPGPSGTRYAAFSGYQFSLNSGRDSFATPAQATQGDLLFAVEQGLPTLTGGDQGKVAPLYNCPPGMMEYFNGNGDLIAGTDIFRTNIAGIGYRVFYYLNSQGYATAPVAYFNEYANGVLVFPFDHPGFGPNTKTRIEIVATGEPIGTGILNASRIYAQVSVSYTGGPMPPGGMYRVALSRNVTITRPTCSVTNQDALSLTLPDATLSALKSGSAGEVKSTDLLVTCGGASMAAPSLSISGATVSGYPATLANQNTTTAGAKGVGVRLWIHDPQTGDFRQPAMGLAESSLGTAVGALPTATWSYRVGASYQQVESTPTAGAVRATATLTFTYS
ncbi:fimbrial protein [Achromobacter sp. NPDC058515]|uniref:fimbrial protein n=1 Tax=Achromobacter sp. NPDC058515 TaxID=3346533 RepID=UPI00366853AE